MALLRTRLILLTALLTAAFPAVTVHAQPARMARVQVTVVDPSSAVIPDATVDLVALDDTTQKVTIPTAKTSGTGVAILEGVTPGNGRTTLRGSVGWFHFFMPPPIIEQSLRLDGEKQRELVIINPSYPDPGIGTGLVPLTNKYLLGDFNLQRSLRYSAGIDQVLSPRVRFNVLYNYIHQQQQARGENLNAPVDGVRPDPTFANIIAIVSDAEIRRHEVFVNATVNFAAQAPGVQQALFNWRRMTVNASYSYIYALNNSGGPWTVPPTGNVEDDWGPGPADSPYRVQVIVTNSQLRNLQVTATYLTFAGFPYNWTTGFDDNRDGFLNDRPAGVGLRTLRGDGHQTVNLRTAYTFNIGRPGSAEPGQTGRYRVQLFTTVTNLANHQNLVGYSGVATSPFFMQPTAVMNLRKLDVGLSVNF